MSLDPGGTGDELDRTFEALGTEVGKLSTSTRRNRTGLILTALGLALDVALSVVVYNVAATARDAAAEARGAKHAAVLLCQAGNDARAQVAGSFDELIALSQRATPPRQLTEAERVNQAQVLDTFEKYLADLRTRRSCTATARRVTATTTTTRPPPHS